MSAGQVMSEKQKEKFEAAFKSFYRVFDALKLW